MRGRTPQWWAEPAGARWERTHIPCHPPRRRDTATVALTRHNTLRGPRAAGRRATHAAGPHHKNTGAAAEPRAPNRLPRLAILTECWIAAQFAKTGAGDGWTPYAGPPARPAARGPLPRPTFTRLHTQLTDNTPALSAWRGGATAGRSSRPGLRPAGPPRPPGGVMTLGAPEAWRGARCRLARASALADPTAHTLSLRGSPTPLRLGRPESPLP